MIHPSHQGKGLIDDKRDENLHFDLIVSQPSQRSIRSSDSNTCFRNVPDAVAAGKLHASLELIVKCLKHSIDTFLAVVL